MPFLRDHPQEQVHGFNANGVFSKSLVNVEASGPVGTGLSICLPRLVMVCVNKHGSREGPAKLFTRDLFTFLLSILIGFLLN